MEVVPVPEMTRVSFTQRGMCSIQFNTGIAANATAPYEWAVLAYDAVMVLPGRGGSLDLEGGMIEHAWVSPRTVASLRSE